MRVRRVDPVQNARSNMVFAQLKTNGVVNKSILDVFEKVPREYFVPVTALSIAYSDAPIFCDIPGRYLFAPQTLGIFLQHLNLSQNDKVLIIGGNYGYTATILFELGYKAYLVESHPILISKCREKLKKYNAIIHVNGTLDCGLKEYAPYKAIIIEMGISVIPDFVVHQLEENGKVAVCLATETVAPARGCIFEKKDGKLQEIFTIQANMPLCFEFTEPEHFTF